MEKLNFYIVTMVQCNFSLPSKDYKSFFSLEG